MLLADLRGRPYAPVADRHLTSFSENMAATYRGVHKVADMSSARELLSDEFDAYMGEVGENSPPHPIRDRYAKLYTDALGKLKEEDWREAQNIYAQWEHGIGDDFRESVFWDSLPDGAEKLGPEGIRARLPERARREEAEWNEVRRRSIGFSGGLGALTGEMGAFLANPVMLGMTAMTLPVGVGAATLSRLGAIAVMARGAGYVGGTEAAIEAVRQTGIWGQREQLELENSWEQAASSVAIAGAFGGILGGGAAGVGKLLQRTRTARGEPPVAPDAAPAPEVPPVRADDPTPVARQVEPEPMIDPSARPPLPADVEVPPILYGPRNFLAGQDGLPRAEFFREDGRRRLMAEAEERIGRIELVGLEEAEEATALLKESLQQERGEVQRALIEDVADLPPNQRRIFTRSVSSFFDEVEAKIDSAIADRRGSAEAGRRLDEDPVVRSVSEEEAEEIAAETILEGDVTLARMLDELDEMLEGVGRLADEVSDAPVEEVGQPPVAVREVEEAPEPRAEEVEEEIQVVEREAEEVADAPVEVEREIPDSGGREWTESDKELRAYRQSLEEQLARQEDDGMADEIRAQLADIDGYGEFMDEVQLCLGRKPAGEGE